MAKIQAVVLQLVGKKQLMSIHLDGILIQRNDTVRMPLETAQKIGGSYDQKDEDTTVYYWKDVTGKVSEVKFDLTTRAYRDAKAGKADRQILETIAAGGTAPVRDGGSVRVGLRDTEVNFNVEDVSDDDTVADADASEDVSEEVAEEVVEAAAPAPAPVKRASQRKPVAAK